MAAPIAVLRAEHAFVIDHFLQAGHHRRRRFLLHQLCVIDLAGCIVENDNQVVLAFVLKPLMTAAIDVQSHPRQRPPHPPFPMRPPFLPVPYQPRSLACFTQV